MRRTCAIVLVTFLLSGCAASSFVVHPKTTSAATKLPISIMRRSNHIMTPTTTISSTSTRIHSDDESSPFLSIRGGGSSSSSSTTTTTTQLQMTGGGGGAFDNGPFYQYNGIIIAANLLGFIISIVTQGSHLHLDLLGTGAFAIAAIPSGFTSNIPRIQLSAGCVALWGTKLASFLFWRALQLKRDSRLEETLSTTSGTATFWFISLVWGIVTALPHSLGATSNVDASTTTILQSPWSVAGACLFLVGFLTETTADYQKWVFKKNNPGTFCNAGLWSISQHPNFCGNMMLWTGIFLMNLPALIDPVAVPAAAGTTPTAAGGGFSLITNLFQTLWRFKRVALAAMSPLFLYTLFNGQASGSFSNTQELANQKYGNDPEFVKYIETVPLLFPNPFK